MSDISPEDDGGQGRGQAHNQDGDGLKGESHALRQKAGDAAQTVKQEAAHFAEAARDKVVEQVDRNKGAMTTAVGDFADAIRKAGEELAGKDQTMAAQLVSQAADGLQALSRTVAEQRPEEMLNAVRRFGRDNPTAFLAGAVLAGVALGRFARSSATHDAGQSPEAGAAPLGASPVTAWRAPEESEVGSAGSIQDDDFQASSEPVGLGVLGDDEKGDDGQINGGAAYRAPSPGAQG